ncbi:MULTISPECIES: hypothetical protein [unclassified Bradyrhizobium]|uniref:hypothetical protein n=1 Tax=unclassified Bradyrhizobium TaxID=2631580 RepID=UPI0028ECE97C|nr:MULTISPECIES: hypothetical protein [unclassified Bradyrhizobium]
MARQKKFLVYKNVTLYRAKKGSREYSSWYALIPNKQVEDGDGVFDIRRLPRGYRNGQELELDLSAARAPESAGYMYDGEGAKQLMELNDDVHRNVLRRAIDDGYNFEAAARGNYGQFFRRLKRWRQLKSGARS